MNLSGKGNERLRVSIVLDGTPGPSLSTSISKRAGIRDRKVQELPGATYRAFHFAPSNDSEATEVAFGFQEAIIRDLNVVQHGKGDRGPAVLFSRVFEPRYATPRDMVVARIRESARLQELSALAAVASTANVLSIGPMPEPDRTPHEQLGPAPLPGMEGMWKVLSAKSPALANIEIDCPDLPKPIENSLPSGLSLFIGRGSELRRLQKLLDSSRLVTLTGSGGTGKTRLACRLGWEMLPETPGGVWFCDLSTARTDRDVISSLAFGLRMQLQPGDHVKQTCSHLAKLGQSLVILDNAEQIAGPVSELLGRFLAEAPSLKLLVTSRSILGLEEEKGFRLEPLGTSGRDMEGVEHSNLLEAACESDAFRLFISRAEDAGAHLPLDEPELRSVFTLLEDLDGLPLAIELAVGMLGRWSLEDLAAGMAGKLDFTAAGGPRRQARWRTVRMALDRSWVRLSPAEMATLAQASVFIEPFTQELAEGVVAFGDNTKVQDVLDSLVRASLLRREESTGTPRYTMLSTIREYASQRLDTMPPDSDGTPARVGALARHARVFSRLEPELELPIRYWSPPIIEAHHRDILAACEFSLQHGDTQTAWRAFRQIEGRMLLIGEFRLGYDLAIRISEGLTEPKAKGETLHLAGLFARDLTEMAEANRLYLLAREQHAKANSHVLYAMSFCDTGFYHYTAGEIEAAERDYNRASELAVQHGITSLEARAHSFRSALLVILGRNEEALASINRARSLCSDDDPKVALLLARMGVVKRAMYDPEGAIECYKEAISRTRAMGDEMNAAHFLTELGNAYYESRNIADARKCYDESASAFRESGSRALYAMAQANTAALEAQQGRVKEALPLLRECYDIVEETNYRVLAPAIRFWLGYSQLRLGESAAAREHLQAAVKSSEENKLSAFQADAMSLLVHCSILDSDPDRAARECEELRAKLPELGEQGRTWSVFFAFGWLAYLSGELEAARREFETSLQLANKKGEFGREDAIAALGLVDLAEGRNAAAAARLDEALAEAALVECVPGSWALELCGRLRSGLTAARYDTGRFSSQK